MWAHEHTLFYPDLTQKLAWEVLTDIDAWAEWHDTLESCELVGELAVGSHFVVKPISAQAVKVVITDVQPGRVIAYYTPFFGAKMHDTTTLEDTPNGLKIHNKITVTGPLAWFWVRHVAKPHGETVEQQFNAMAERIKHRNQAGTA